MNKLVHAYTLKYRPASFATCPKGWKYLASGKEEPLLKRPELPGSRYRFGIIGYERQLSIDEVNAYEMMYLGKVDNSVPATTEPTP